MSDPKNGTPRGQPAQVPPPSDPNTISTEVYLLDALIQHVQTVVNQFAYRRRIDLAQALHQLAGPIAAFRQQVDADTRTGGIVRVGADGLPPTRQ